VAIFLVTATTVVVVVTLQIVLTIEIVTTTIWFDEAILTNRLVEATKSLFSVQLVSDPQHTERIKVIRYGSHVNRG